MSPHDCVRSRLKCASRNNNDISSTCGCSRVNEEHAVARQQRSLKPSYGNIPLSSLLKLPKVAPQLGESKTQPAKDTMRATPRRKAKAAMSYDLSRPSLWESKEDLQGNENILDSEWAESGEEEFSDVEQGNMWKALPVPSKYQQGFRTENERNIKATPDLIDRTSAPEGRPSTAQLMRKFAAQLDEYKSGFTSASDSDSAAIIRFSPPRLKSPSKRPPPQASTPPQSPSKFKLNSPTKAQQKIPPTPHRPSIDAFWSQDVVNTWNDQYSPRKILKSPCKIPLPESDDDDFEPVRLESPSRSPCKSPTKVDKSVLAARKRFEQEKHRLAEEFLQEVDKKINGGEIGRLAGSTGGIKLIWSKKLNSTAGRANWRREAIKARSEDGATVSTTYQHLASIELAEKVIDNEHRLLNVLAHEYCHLANFMISNIRDQPHGASFKRWAAKVSSAFADRDIEVTTKHSYEIKYKYSWICIDEERCGVEYQRHSKSIDPLKHACGKCKGRLRQIRPVPRKTKSLEDGEKGALGNGGETSGKNEYQRFVKEHFGKVREELGVKSPMKDVMKELGARYRSRKDHVITDDIGREDKSRTLEVIEILDGDDDDGVPMEQRGNGTPREGEVDRVSRVLDFLTIHDE